MVALVNVPVPVVVHSKLLKLVALAKVVWVLKLNATPWHVSASLPALTVADGVIVSTIWSFTLAHVPLPLAVSVKVTFPVSPTPGW